MQRAATTQSEAERLLAGARDLEESIGVSLSARRFEVRNTPAGGSSWLSKTTTWKEVVCVCRSHGNWSFLALPCRGSSPAGLPHVRIGLNSNCRPPSP